MACDLDPQQAEVVRRNWLISELTRVGVRVAEPVRGQLFE